MQLFYQGVEIYNDVSIHQCIYDSYGERQSDTLRIIFNDGNDLWDAWRPQKGDTIQAILGAGNTGVMYVTAVEPKNGKMTIRASSTPDDKNIKTGKSWNNIRFKSLCTEIGQRHGLTTEFYGVDDYIYTYVTQQNQEDFIFLESRCMLEGCAFLVYDGKLIVYSEKAMESQNTPYSLVIPREVKFEYQDKRAECYGACELSNGSFVGKFCINKAQKVLRKTVNLRISSQAEADRFAMNLLRYENKKSTSGIVTSDIYLPGYAAGSVVNLQTDGITSWNVPVMMKHVRHDMVKASTKLFFRKTLEGY